MAVHLFCRFGRHGKSEKNKEEHIWLELWGGRFTKETDQLVYNFNASISFDKKFYKQDITGSMAHVKMLAKSGILAEEERDSILRGLEGILADVENGSLCISDKYEDIHSFVEATLIDRIGDTGKKLHTGRSRNDQVALDMKLYTRDELLAIRDLVLSLIKTCHQLMKENIHTAMPGFTHCKKHSRLPSLIISALIWRCLNGITTDWATSISG